MARGLGAELPLGTAVAAYYRSLFLNLTLPGGVVGDVHRGFGHGLRAVAWERSAGQVVQVALTVAVLLVLPSPVQAADAARRPRAPRRGGRRGARAARAAGSPGARGGRGCAAPSPATCATGCSPGGRGRPSRSRRR